MDCIVLTLYRVEFTNRVRPVSVVIRTAPPAGRRLQREELVRRREEGGGRENELEVLR